jgi:general stress protein 26
MMNRREEQTERTEGIRKVVEGFQTAMLVSHAEDGALRARPMSLAKVDERGDVYFVTAIDSAKTDELSQDERAAVVMQSATQFVSLSGRADFLLDAALVQELWRETWRPWFPDGPEDPELCVLRVRCDDAEV